ncbi:hypothetical protein [Taylorella equigenitalis]|uniref:Uncharacterized protein n=2 Tax=Taylorella equigenitalis TaxID=29575 RepID=A0A654KIJ9_TAYEM|nr:hypothetical protein [Taylorella equigenitalis]ADU92235.1 hypothetical protein TEQUI_1315 [Taylorella equigenitalis MCE9]ASY37736.1 hypothetical protein CA605_03345 [Taylorella equigenitalis]ASY42158.1 hypothetical protein CA943_03355 [Taylorella equigenitalis]KGK33308.1 hypothetical protein LW90_06460 [Taylorella equigenitalis]RBA26472.1 hypothetical protein DQW13_05580 [Taylorella equigenitalis]
MRLGLLASTTNFKTATWTLVEGLSSGANYFEIPQEFLTALPPSDSPDTFDNPIICLSREKQKSNTDHKTRYSIGLTLYVSTRQIDSNKSGMYYGAFWEGQEEQFFSPKRLPIAIETLKSMAAYVRDAYVESNSNSFSEKPFIKEFPDEIGDDLKTMDSRFLESIKFSESISPKDADRTCVIGCSKKSNIPDAIETIIDYKMLALYKRIYFVSNQIFDRFKRIQNYFESKNFEATVGTNLTLLRYEDLKAVKNIYLDSIGSVESVISTYTKRLRQKDEAYQLLKNNQTQQISNLTSEYESKIKNLESDLEASKQALADSVPATSSSNISEDSACELTSNTSEDSACESTSNISSTDYSTGDSTVSVPDIHSDTVRGRELEEHLSSEQWNQLRNLFGLEPTDSCQVLHQKLINFSNESNKHIDEMDVKMSELSTKLADRESRLLELENAPAPDHIVQSARRGFNISTFLLMLLVIALVAYILINR